MKANMRRTVAVGTIGNVLEWYDFAVYGYFAAAIGKHFFPHEDPIAQLLAAFGVFAVGYMMRPVGGVIIGHIGDRYGRRAALVFSVTAMAVPTTLIGLLPGYAAIGIAAPIALTLLRMIQGLSVGGEHPSSVVFLVEHAPEGRRGLMGAFASCGAVAGILLGSAMGALFASMMSAEALETWGWRIPFLGGFVVGVAGYFLRRHLSDAAPAGRGTRTPIVETFREHGWLVGRLAMVSVFNAVAFYVIFVFVVSWLQQADGISPANALGVNTVNMALLIPVMVFGGWLSDRVGRKYCLLAATALGFITAWPLFVLMHQGSVHAALLGQLGFVICVGLFIATQPTFMVESTPAHIRCTAVALGYNLSLGIVGGLTPLAATWLIERTEDQLAPAFMVMAAAAISFLATLRLAETHRTPLPSAQAAGERTAPHPTYARA
jgi:MHS family proline/betaine transporter-like MFS transporter